jgi:hypothetical protein
VDGNGGVGVDGNGGVGVASVGATRVLSTGESPQVAKSCMLDPRPRNMELALCRREVWDGGVEKFLRFSVISSVEELFALRRPGEGGGLSVLGMRRSGFRRWAICLMNFMVAVSLALCFSSFPCPML